ncbi:MAG TPA: hypothetical protein VEK85_05225 [Gemmatimonadales bacterium]|nr:hypothetical protein [Gemmatimonadales bacterium]
MRLSIITMSAALVALSTPLGAQRRGAWTVGFAGTLGGGWQVEAADVGYARAVRAGPMRVASLTARLGSFVDEGAILGGARGFVFGLTLGGHTGLLPLADLGTETSKSEVGVDLTVEGTAYLGARSPFPQGSRWGALTVLPGLKFGDPDGVQFGLLLGPTLFFGQASDVRPFLGIRFEAPLARRESHP